jgi:hypothetical protein
MKILVRYGSSRVPIKITCVTGEINASYSYGEFFVNVSCLN